MFISCYECGWLIHYSTPLKIGTCIWECKKGFFKKEYSSFSSQEAATIVSWLKQVRRCRSFVSPQEAQETERIENKGW